MVQDSPPSKEAANLATPTVLNAQEISTTAQNVSQDSQLTQNQENVFLKLVVLTVKLLQLMDNVLTSVTLDSTSTKEFVSMEDVSMDTLLTPTQDASETSTIPTTEDQIVFLLSSFPMDNVLVPVKMVSTLITQANSVFLALPTAKLASLDHSVLFV